MRGTRRARLRWRTDMTASSVTTAAFVAKLSSDESLASTTTGDSETIEGTGAETTCRGFSSNPSTVTTGWGGGGVGGALGCFGAGTRSGNAKPAATPTGTIQIKCLIK